MIKSAFFWLFMMLPFISCKNESEIHEIDKWKAEIIQTEKEFSQMAQKEGISQAFLTYAADDAVLMRNNTLVIGIDSIRMRFLKTESDPSKASLSWTPDFVDVSSSGDLGYTYGTYVYKWTDSLGNISSDTGVFHTVWKRQPNGDWKFVWD
jgi:ketosteroid isomerase-like protein